MSTLRATEAVWPITAAAAETHWPVGWTEIGDGRIRVLIRGIQVEMFYRSEKDGGGYAAELTSAMPTEYLHASSLFYLVRLVRERVLSITDVTVPQTAAIDGKEQLWLLLLKVLNKHGAGWVQDNDAFTVSRRLGSDGRRWAIKVETAPWHGFQLFLLLLDQYKGEARTTTLAVHLLTVHHTEMSVVLAVESLFSSGTGLVLHLKRDEPILYPGNVKIY